MTRRRRTILIAVLAALALCGATAVCAGAYFVATSLGLATGKPAAGQTATQPHVTAGTSSGNTLVVYGGLPPTLDPAMVQDSTSAEYVVHLFSGLVSLNHALEVVPDLADQWSLSEDGRTYRFSLNAAARFADGCRITADDVVYSLHRACDPALGSPVAGTYLGDIVGVTDYIAGKSKAIAGVAAEGSDVVTITIDAPKAYFLAKLTYPTAFVVDRNQIEREGAAWESHPNGSGPFVLVSASRSRIVLRRNERYYRGLPALEQVEFVLQGGVPISMYENDELDVAAVGPDDVERVMDPDNPLSAEYHMAPELSVDYVAFNVSRPPFDDPLVRQAIAHSIDTRKIAELVLNNTALPARGIAPPGLLGDDAPPAALAYDPAVARELLAQSRYGQPGAMPEVVLSVSGTSGFMPAVPGAVIHMISETLSIPITVEQVEWSDFLDDLNRGRYQMFSAGWMGDYPDPQNFIDLLFHSASAQNHCGYADATVDRLLEEARVESDSARRTALYREAEQRILADAPWIPLTHGVSVTLVKPHVQGFHSSASLYPWLTDITLAR